MYVQLKSQKDNRSRAVVNSASQKEFGANQESVFINNRPAVAIERILKGTIDSHSNAWKNILPIQTVKSVKNLGNSQKLARRRYRLKKKKFSFKRWKQGREAQHLIPAAVCAIYNIPEVWVNSAENGMMLPSGRSKTHSKRIKSLDKGKVAHIRGGGAHPNYNRVVTTMTQKRNWVKGKVTMKKFLALAKVLRKKNRPNRKGPSQGYVNDIKL